MSFHTLKMYAVVAVLVATAMIASQPVSLSPSQQWGAAQYEMREHSRASTRAGVQQAQFIIVVPSAWEDVADELAQWKEMQGISTAVYTVEYIESVSPGYDTGEKIQSFLRTQKQQNQEFTYLLLFADTEYIPARQMYVGASQYGIYDFIPSDFYYAALDSGWDGDMDHTYGEDGNVDYIADVAVGRLPVNTHSEASAVLNKIMSYERYPSDGSWYDRAILVGGLMAPPYSDEYDSWEDNAYKVQQIVKPHIQEMGMNITEMYDLADLDGSKYIPESSPSTNDNLTHDKLMPEYNKGASIMNLVSQGYTNGNGLGDYAGDGTDWTYNHLFYYTDVQYSTNTGLPFVYISSCNSGNFTEEDDSDMEVMITNPVGGAIGLIAATQLSFRGETASGTGYGNWWLNERFWDIFSSGNTNPALAMLELKRNYYYEKYLHNGSIPGNLIVSNLLAYNYLGDPTVDIYTAPPVEPVLASPLAFYEGTYDYTFRIEGNGLDTVNATIVMDRPVKQVLHTDSNGEVTVELTLAAGDAVDFAVWGHNLKYKVFNETAQAYPADLYIGQEDITLPDNVSFNKEFNIMARVHCSGADAAGVKAYLYADSDVIDTADVPPIPEGLSSLVTFSATMPAPGTYDMAVVIDPDNSLIESDETNNRVDFQLTVGGIDVAVWSPSLDPYPTPGRTSTLTFHIGSKGSVSPGEVYVQVLDSSGGTVADTTVQSLSSADTTVSLDIDVVEGMNYLAIHADPLNEIVETDESNNVVEMQITLNALPAFITIPTITTEEDTALADALHLADYCSDDSLPEPNTYTVVEVGTGINVTLNGDSVSITPDPDFYGQTQFTVRASDGIGEDTAVVPVNVTPVNDPPVLEKSEYQVSAHVGDSVELSINATDPDGDALEFSASEGSIDHEGHFTYDVASAGNKEIVITVSDGGASSICRVTIQATSVNHPPVITFPGNKTAKVGERFVMKVEATDPDGDALTYTSDSMLFTINSTTGVIEFTPNNDMVGKHTVTVTVSDGKDKATTTFVIDVKGSGKGSGTPGFLSSTVIISLLGTIVLLRRKHK